jgi:hypothetical protein
MRGTTIAIALAAAAVFGFGGNFTSVTGASLFGTQAALAKSDKQSKVSDWFQQYDQIRRQAQMSDSERERSRGLMAQGMAASFMQSANAAQDKAAASALLRRMVQRYQLASSQMSTLPRIPETKKLYDAYTQYFQEAGALFSDYLRVQNNLFATDGAGKGLVGQLAQRKSDLEMLDAANKDLDARLRDKFGVAAYAY